MFLSIILISLHVQVAFWQLLINEHDHDDKYWTDRRTCIRQYGALYEQACWRAIKTSCWWMILRRLLNDAVRKWPITKLTYRFYNYPSRALSPTDVASVIERAFKVFQFCSFYILFINFPSPSVYRRHNSPSGSCIPVLWSYYIIPVNISTSVSQKVGQASFIFTITSG